MSVLGKFIFWLFLFGFWCSVMVGLMHLTLPTTPDNYKWFMYLYIGLATVYGAVSTSVAVLIIPPPNEMGET